MSSDLLLVFHLWLKDALEQTTHSVDPVLKELVLELLKILLKVPPMINRIASSKVGVLVAHLNDPSKSQSLLNKDPGVKQCANEVKDAWTKAQQLQKTTGRLPGDIASAAIAKPSAPPVAVAAPLPQIPTFATLPSFDMPSSSDMGLDARGSGSGGGKRKNSGVEEAEEKKSKKSKERSEKRRKEGNGSNGAFFSSCVCGVCVSRCTFSSFFAPPSPLHLQKKVFLFPASQGWMATST